MFNTKTVTTKLALVSSVAIMTVSLLNVQTAYGYVVPGGDSNKVTAVVPRPGNPQPVTPTPAPRPIPRPSPTPVPSPRPQPDPRPIPRPTPRPTPRPYPVPIPVPVPYPGPVYPGPIYPSPGYPSYPPPVNYTQYKTAYVNRWVYNENFYVYDLLSYGYSNYRIRNIRIDVSGDSAASVSLLVNGQLIETKYTSGSDVYLYPGYYGEYNNSSLRIVVSGAAYVYNIVFELERRY